MLPAFVRGAATWRASSRPILMIQRVLAPHVQRILLDFWTAAYQAIDD